MVSSHRPGCGEDSSSCVEVEELKVLGNVFGGNKTLRMGGTNSVACLSAVNMTVDPLRYIAELQLRVCDIDIRFSACSCSNSTTN